MTTELAGRRLWGPEAWVSTRAGPGARSWRARRPALDLAKCTGCLICWKFCPEPAILRSGEKVAIDLASCKGCGVCAVECPVHAIAMVDEEGP
ncbi:MAG: 4Fe-4S binding protein [Euryarchaeota archaeon]|nr:4Fe-4S binding protein [Euryarchaeota archaeon]